MTDQAIEAVESEGPIKVPRKGLSGKKLVLFIVLPLLLLGGGGAVYLFKPFGLFASNSKKEEAAAAKLKPAVFYNVPNILVNLNSNTKRTHFLKLSIAFELRSEADSKALEAVLPRVIDNFQVYLHELRIEDLEGAAGIQRLREELLLRVNEAVKPVAVKDVLFKEMLVQ